ncbi:MAG TPA: hypothetical protein VHU44_03250 [Acidobacteriaceae bacterium]|jgi:plastocyanin|nr:hypothetical protein [Acidobacteriaceae bacterium]
MRVLSLIVLATIAGFSTAATAAAPASDTAPCDSPRCTAAAPQEISGLITINRKLTRPSVTAAVSMYQRGATVSVGKDSGEDPLTFERSHVIVYLEGPQSAAASAARHASFRMEQQNRRFSPDLLVVPVGATVSFPNMDPIFHNIFSLSKAKEFDLGSYDKGDSRNVTFTRPGVVSVFCHLHPNMEGTIVVAPSQYFARVDGTGAYHLPAVPPGEYTIVAWHKAAGFFRKQIVVEAGHNATADFLIPLPPEPQQKQPEPEHSMAHMGGH